MTLSYGYEKNDTGVTLTDRYGEAEGVVEVPGEWKGKTVTAIGEELFRGEKKLTAVILPPTVVSIGWWALRDCVSLKEIRAEGPLKEIGYRAFSGCTSLTSVDLPETVEHIGEAAFWGCSALKRIRLPEKIRVLRNRTFYGCRHLTDVELPPNLRAIEWGAFEHCAGLRSLTVPESVTKIGSNALRECGGLKELNLADGTEAISEHLFGHRKLPPLERGYIPNAVIDRWEEDAAVILSLCYLTTMERHSEDERAMYEDYIFSRADSILTAAVETANLPALEGLYHLGLPGESDIDDWIDRANDLRCRDVVVSLLAYKHRRFGRRSAADSVAAVFALGDFEL